MAEKQDRERFEELASTLVKEMQMAGFVCHFDGPTSASFSRTGSSNDRHIKFGYSGYRWWVERGLFGEYGHPDFDAVRRDIMRWVRGEW